MTRAVDAGAHPHRRRGLVDVAQHRAEDERLVERGELDMEAILPSRGWAVARARARRARAWPARPDGPLPWRAWQRATAARSGLDQPEVRAWLARLETEAAVLPEDRRTELRASVEDYLADAARDAGPDGAPGRRARPRRAGVTRRAGRRGGRLRRVPRRRRSVPAPTPTPPPDHRGWRSRR